MQKVSVPSLTAIPGHNASNSSVLVTPLPGTVEQVLMMGVLPDGEMPWRSYSNV
jgi:hypothetical protein